MNVWDILHCEEVKFFDTPFDHVAFMMMTMLIVSMLVVMMGDVGGMWLDLFDDIRFDWLVELSDSRLEMVEKMTVSGVSIIIGSEECLNRL